MWALTDWLASTLYDGVILNSTTDTPVHLWAIWTLTPPTRLPVYKINRGVRFRCGWRYVLLNPTATEQTQPGDTSLHTFYLWPIPCETSVWFILAEQPAHAPGIPSAGIFTYQTDACDMPSLLAARVYRSTPQTIASHTDTVLAFDSVRYDIGGLYGGPANPSRLIAPVDGLYAAGATLRWALRLGGARYAWITRGAAFLISSTTLGVLSVADQWVDHNINAHYYLTAGQYLQVGCRQTSGAGLQVVVRTAYSLEFWMARIPGII